MPHACLIKWVLGTAEWHASGWGRTAFLFSSLLVLALRVPFTLLSQMSGPYNKEVNWCRLSSGLIFFLERRGYGGQKRLAWQGKFSFPAVCIRHDVNRTGIIERFGGFMWLSVIERNWESAWHLIWIYITTYPKKCFFFCWLAFLMLVSSEMTDFGYLCMKTHDTNHNNIG